MTDSTKIPPSKYLDYFKENRAQFKEQFELIGDIILVERVTFEHITASGLVLARDTRNQINSIAADEPHFYRVLLPGEGYYDDETKEPVALNVQQGDFILVPSTSVKFFSIFPRLEGYEPSSIGVTRESEIQWRFKGEESFAHFTREFNQAAKAKMGQNKQAS
jgi:co-chaperonin GroES (HSP10)